MKQNELVFYIKTRASEDGETHPYYLTAFSILTSSLPALGLPLASRRSMRR